MIPHHFFKLWADRTDWSKTENRCIPRILVVVTNELEPLLADFWMRGKSDCDGLSNRAKSVPALDPGRGLYRALSPAAVTSSEVVGRIRSPSPPKVRTPVKVPERFKSPESSSSSSSSERFRSPEARRNSAHLNQVMNGKQEQNGVVDKSAVNGTAKGNITAPCGSLPDSTDDQGLTRKKVVKVVRRVVRKVLPSGIEETNAPTHSSEIPEVARNGIALASVSKGPLKSTFSFKHDTIKTEDNDDISRGLTNLMVRGRTREPRPRIRKDDHLEAKELDKKNENKKEKQVQTKEEVKEDAISLKSQEANQDPPTYILATGFWLYPSTQAYIFVSASRLCACYETNSFYKIVPCQHSNCTSPQEDLAPSSMSFCLAK
ncbi:uncharacterized protein LOC144033526 [Festucalex cinctus]